MMVKKLFAQLKEFKRHLFLNSSERWLSSYNRSVLNSLLPTRELKILIQMPESYCELIVFSSVIRSLKREGFCLDLRWINVNNSFQRAGKLGFLKRNRWFERKWTKLYLSHGGKVVFSHLFYRNRLVPVRVNQATAIFESLKSKEALVDLEMDGLRVGDLIYDTYLRYKPAATVDLRDPFLKEILIAALHIVHETRECLDQNKPDLLISSYASYIHHGIMVRAALEKKAEKKIKIISFGSYDQIAKEIRPEYPSHVKNYFHYPELFQALSPDEQKQAKEKALGYLEKRFGGKKDLAMYYMASSAFTRESSEQTTGEMIFKPTGRKRIVIFLHCFFDSPHGYRRMLYPDFYEWLSQTLQLLENSESDVYVKAHPNGVPGNEEIIERIAKKFPQVTFIHKRTNNTKMIQEGFDLGVTVHGTLAHEYPYFGIPVLNAGDNPHIDYDFCTHAKTREEYERYLRNIELVRKPTEQDREKILEFYYMHNIHPFPGRRTIEEMAFVNLNTREVIWEEDFKSHIEKCKDPKFIQKLEQLIQQSFKEVL